MGKCKKLNPFRGAVTVSDKGQIVIPAQLLRELNIKKGNRLFVLKRSDDLGFVVLKSDAISDMLDELVNNNPL